MQLPPTKIWGLFTLKVGVFTLKVQEQHGYLEGTNHIYTYIYTAPVEDATVMCSTFKVLDVDSTWQVAGCLGANLQV